MNEAVNRRNRRVMKELYNPPQIREYNPYIINWDTLDYLNNHLKTCIVYSIQKPNAKTTIVSIKDNKYIHFNNYSFYIGIRYPFIKPHVKIDGEDYLTILKDRLHIFNTHIRRVAGICSFSEHSCCQNSSLNWSPARTIFCIIKEITYYRTIMRNCIIKILCQKITGQYLINDINLLEWLIFPYT
jgi:hypothetical protein